MSKIVGLCGFSRVGKDTASMHMPGYHRIAFADNLKARLRNILEDVCCDLTNPADKEKARPLMVELGRTVRAFDPDHWIRQAFYRLDYYESQHFKTPPRFIITDVRYANEVQAILDKGGIVIRIHRPGYGPANLEEERSFAEIEETWPDMPSVLNDGTPEELGRKVLAASE